MTGSIDATPWARNAVDTSRLRQRVPSGFCLHLSGASARGPWRVYLTRGGQVMVDLGTRADLPEAIEDVLTGPVLTGPDGKGPLVTRLRRVP